MQHRRVIKQGPVVLATQEDGSMDPSSPSSQGLFLADTRFLSLFRLYLNELTPVLLGSSEEILFESSFLHTNPALTNIPARALGILQHNKIGQEDVGIEISLANWSLSPVDVTFSIELDSDYFDSFEARGVKRLRRGKILPPVADGPKLRLEYHGLDHVTRITDITADPPFDRFENKRMYFTVKLKANESLAVKLCIKMKEEAAKTISLQAEPERGSLPKPP